MEGHKEPTATAAVDSADDKNFELQPTLRQYQVAEVYNAKGRGVPGEEDAGSVAGSDATDLSQAATESRKFLLHKKSAKDGLEGAGHVKQTVACKHPPRCKCAWPMPRYMDTHRPVRVGGGYRPPQDRPPPVAGS